MVSATNLGYLCLWDFSDKTKIKLKHAFQLQDHHTQSPVQVDQVLDISEKDLYLTYSVRTHCLSLNKISFRNEEIDLSPIKRRELSPSTDKEIDKISILRASGKSSTRNLSMLSTSDKLKFSGIKTRGEVKTVLKIDKVFTHINFDFSKKGAV